jgi:hypothetical protein
VNLSVGFLYDVAIPLAASTVAMKLLAFGIRTETPARWLIVRSNKYERALSMTGREAAATPWGIAE